jgi:chromosome segregation ATPase
MKVKALLLAIPLLVTILVLGVSSPPSLAQQQNSRNEGIPPELEEYRARIQEALGSLQEALQALGHLREQLKEGRRELLSELKKKGREARRTFSSELRELFRNYREIFSRSRSIQLKMKDLRRVRNEVAAAVRSGDIDKAKGIFEGALREAEALKGELEGLAGELKELISKQAELVQKVRDYAPSGGDNSDPLEQIFQFF